MSETFAGHTAQLRRQGVLIFLNAANAADSSALELGRLWARRQRHDQPSAKALWHGACTLQRECDSDLEALRERGGLLHFRHAQVMRTDDGEYVLVGAA